MVVAVPTPSSQLEVVGVAVAAGTMTPDSESGDVTAEPGTVRMTLRNAGSLVSVVSAVELTIRDHSYLEICEAGGGLPISGSYDVLLPTSPQPDHVLDLDIVHEVPANDSDRFELALQVPQEEMGLGVHVYQLEIRLTVDGERTEDPVSTVVIPVPTNLEFYVDPGGAAFEGDVGDCYRRNLEEANRIDSWEGTRPPDLMGAVGD